MRQMSLVTPAMMIVDRPVALTAAAKSGSSQALICARR